MPTLLRCTSGTWARRLLERAAVTKQNITRHLNYQPFRGLSRHLSSIYQCRDWSTSKSQWVPKQVPWRLCLQALVEHPVWLWMQSQRGGGHYLRDKASFEWPLRSWSWFLGKGTAKDARTGCKATTSGQAAPCCQRLTSAGICYTDITSIILIQGMITTFWLISLIITELNNVLRLFAFIYLFFFGHLRAHKSGLDGLQNSKRRL